MHHDLAPRVAGLARRLSFALALAAGAADALQAQRGLLFGPGAEFVGAGVSRLATGALDERLRAEDFPTFGRTPLALSLGGYRILPNGVTLGAEWHGVVYDNEEREGRDVGLGGGYGTLSLGYAIELSPRTRVYPRLGLGAGGLGLWIEDREADVGFGEVLADPERYRDTLRHRDQETVLGHASVLMDLGAGAELLSRVRGRGPMVGLRVGYVLMPFATNWRVNERRVRDGPDASLAGPYVRVVVGTGRRR